MAVDSPIGLEFAIVTGSVVFALNKFADRWLLGPRLKINYTDQTLDQIVSFSKEEPATQTSNFTINVINDSIHAAKNCKLLLIHFSEKSRTIVKVNGQLSWINTPESEKFRTLDIPKGFEAQGVLLTVWYPTPTEENEPSNEPECPQRYAYVSMAGQNAVLKVANTVENNYTFKMMVTGENCEPYVAIAQITMVFMSGRPVLFVRSFEGIYLSKFMNLIDLFCKDINGI